MDTSQQRQITAFGQKHRPELVTLVFTDIVGNLTRPVATDWANDISDPLLREDLHHCFAGNPQDRFAAAGLLEKISSGGG